MQIKFEWTPSISVNNEIIDSQHKELLKKINELLTAILEKRGQEIIEGIVRFLGEYIEGHLRYEEEYMEKHLYPELKEHKEIHNKFVERYNDFEEKIKLGIISVEMSHDVEVFLGEWWINHIGHEDKRYADFIKEND